MHKNVKSSSPSMDAGQPHWSDDEENQFDLLREKSSHITKAARSATLANVLAPLLCIPMFKDEVPFDKLAFWLGYMFVVVSLRTGLIFRLEHKVENIQHPQRDLKVVSYAVAMVGFGWGLGWVLLVPDLLMVNRMIYVYMTTAAMISSMFAYSVHQATFLAFTLPIMIPSLSTVLWPAHLLPWPFLVGLVSLYVVVLSIAKNFAATFENSVRLRSRNERLYRELASERDQSVAANVAKSKFIAAASHDLRQPMHAVNVYLELIHLENVPASEKKLLAKIKSSITALNAMFDALLNISKLDADALQVKHSTFHLKSLADALRDLTEAKAHNKGLALHMTCPDLVVQGDKLLLQQMVSNLLSNAIQYTEQGQVAVTFAAFQGCLSIDVSDTGLGIEPSEQAHIFHEFYRADKTRTLHDGLGLGLSIVQRLCNLIGASIQVRSQPGQGTTFTVTTPFPVATREDDIQAVKPAPPIQAPSRSLEGKHIVVIEDNPIIVEAYRQILSSKGAQVQVLSENESEMEAQLATIGRIDCIMSDYRLDQTTGDVLIQKLRDNYNAEIPAIIVTADTSPSHIHLFAELNIQVLHKPVSFQEVAAAIKKTMEAT